MTTLTIGKQFATAVADYISAEMFPPHRGVIEVRNPFGGCRCLAAFGNDGYRQNERTRVYADALLAELAEQGLWDAELGIDSDDGYTWAILVKLDPDEPAHLYQAAIEDELYSQFRAARGLADGDGFVLLRKSICDREIIEHTNGEPLTISGWESVN
jgi:hypothetical protein